jgi:AmmeMemoRadiSam system protein A
MPSIPSLEGPRAPLDAAPPPAVTPDAQRALLELVQVALAVATRSADVSAIDRALERIPADVDPAPAFVTLTEDGELRGCMGCLEPTRGLGETVVRSAVLAAQDDPRFLPVTAWELPGIHVEISVLGPPMPILDPDAFRPGIDGVIVDRNGRRGLLLPEVATDLGWGAAEMFDAVCRKAGLPRDAWRDPVTRLSTFRTVRFGGPATAIATAPAAPTS